ncbi:DNA polymerase I [Zophobihabitans entericus]|uniref:DNA polymerase I n=1 Tax=Zophobihabitans entericus TaxID=1635327 RepID=A0A6G9I8E8_9GAMM|nr:DNA polymerase I [Zophobihabitans entericus]QIQ20486.1 DNA polymerase I [Zophobihabitans entericus]
MKDSSPIILIDGSSYLYRAFFACPPLTNSKGEPTGAIFGVINMLRSLINQYKPKHIAVVFDAKGGSFRNELYKEYKATREAMPDDLILQVEPIHKIITAMGLPLFCIEGVEADDVIGTIALHCEQRGIDVLISTGDKDMAQLVSDKITLINTMTNSVLTPQGVVDKFGVPPELIIDFLALMGDKSDNIPGVPGIGEKTASALLSALPGLKSIYENIDEVANLSIRGAKSLKEKLLTNKDEAMLSYKLATIKTDIELDITAEQLQPKVPDMSQLSELFAYYGFNRWIADINNNKFINLNGDGAEPPAPVAAQPAKNNVTHHQPESTVKHSMIKVEQGYETILTHKELDKWLDQLAKAEQFAFDTETNSLNSTDTLLIGLSFCIEPGKAAYLPVNHFYLGVPDQLPLGEVIAKIKPIMENEKIKKIGQNLKFDCNVLAQYGVIVKGLTYDTMLESYILNSNNRHDMDTLALKHLNHQTITYTELTKKGNQQFSIDEIEIEEVSKYAAEDADVTLQLHHSMWQQLKADSKLADIFTNIEMPLVEVLSKMETTGVLINKELLIEYSAELAEKLKQLEEEMYLLAGEEFNPASPKQLQKILFEKLSLPVIKKTPKGDPSTNEEVLTELAHDFELPKIILKYRGLAKLKNTYTDKLPLMVSPKDHRIHTSYNQTGTITGRLSSSDPNLQNIPVRNEEGRKIRQAFIAPKGYKIISADYSQIELRIMAHLSKDKGLLAAFEQGKDIHRVTAAETLGIPEDTVTSEQRRNAKAVNFGLIYGMSAFGLARQLGIARKEAQFYIDRYFERYPGIQTYMEETRQLATEQGYVETVSGRRLYLPSIKSSSAIERKGAERAAINAPMQGTAADIIKTAMIDINKWIEQRNNDDIRMIMQVHDELVFEVKESLVEQISKEIKDKMENCFKLSTPLKVDAGIGDNWDEAH